MRLLLRDESGFTLVELLVATVITTLLVAGLANMFVSGMRASLDANSRLTSQSSVRLAFDRLEYEARCASTATLGASGADVTLVLPSGCAHGNGTYTWCVSGGVLTRYTNSACSGTSQIFASSVTSATPFSCLSTVNQYPRLQVSLAVNPVSRSSDAFSATDTMDMHNAALTTSSSTACS
jgi:prepilin-type N-terminal cleavage/methylation domain-containing protein